MRRQPGKFKLITMIIFFSEEKKSNPFFTRNCNSWFVLPRNVPLPCYPDAPLYQFEDLAELERDEVQTLPLCYQYACQTLDNKL